MTENETLRCMMEELGDRLERRLLKRDEYSWPWTGWDWLRAACNQNISTLGTLLREQIEEQLCEFPQT